MEEDCLNMFPQKTGCGDNAIGGMLTVVGFALHLNAQSKYSCVKTSSKGEQLPSRVTEDGTALQAQ